MGTDKMKSLLLTGFLVSLSNAFQEVSSPEYISLPAAQKNEIIWSNVLEDLTPADWFGLLDLPGIFTESMCPTLRAPGDELPWEEGIIQDGTRYKYIHTVGAVGQVEWRNLGGHSFSGIFTGATKGVVRFSLAKEPLPPALNTAPGMGLKFLRDGVDSANLVAMYGVDGQDSWNFFKNDFTNHIGPGSLALVPLEIKFSEATNYISECGLSNWANYGEDGVIASSLSFPFMLRFRPTGEISFPDEYVNDFLVDLTSIPKGSTLYQVWALDVPEELGGTETHIADLVLTSDMTTSNWGDKHLFFRHQDMADDVVLRPEWEDYLDKFGIEGDSGCPFNKMNRKGRVADNQ